MIRSLAWIAKHVSREPKHQTAHLYEPVIRSCSVVRKAFAVPEFIDKRVVLVVDHRRGHAERARVTVVVDYAGALVKELASPHHGHAIIRDFVKVKTA